MAEEPVLYDEAGGIVTLTLNRPETRNAITDDDMIAALVAALERMNADMGVRVAILTGAGTAFCSGGNLKRMAERAGPGAKPPVESRRWYKAGIHRIPLAFETLEVPIIAAVNGPAIGAGCDLACMCDIRIAGERASFAESFVKLGIISGDGGAWLLPRVVGYSKACEMTFTGDAVDAKAALACGLVSQLVPDAELMAAAKALAARIAANPPHAMRLTKRLLQEGRHTRLSSLLELAAAMQSLAHATRDHKEAVDAFLAKRKPAFKGD
jgi:enoyl-CoA hydratase/carnithine racemase